MTSATAESLAAAIGPCEYQNNNGQICSCDRRIYDKSRPRISTGYATGYEKGRTRNLEKGRKP